MLLLFFTVKGMIHAEIKLFAQGHQIILWQNHELKTWIPIHCHSLRLFVMYKGLKMNNAELTFSF